MRRGAPGGAHANFNSIKVQFEHFAAIQANILNTISIP